MTNNTFRKYWQRILFFLFFFFGLFITYSQTGRLLLVGGGAEKNGVSSWSTPAYRWAGEGKRVAIIGTSTGTLAPYFIQQCGAVRAKEFAIDSHDSADSQATYDTLISYDVIFFRGGDRSFFQSRSARRINHPMIYKAGGFCYAFLERDVKS